MLRGGPSQFQGAAPRQPMLFEANCAVQRGDAVKVIAVVAIDPTHVQAPIYSGDASGGTLTVTDGSHTAQIALLGNYLASTFVASSDGHGGTMVVDPALPTSSAAASLAPSQH